MKKELLISFLESKFELNPCIFLLKENDIKFLHGDMQLRYFPNNKLETCFFSSYQYKKNVDENWYGIELCFDNSRLKPFIEVMNLHLQSIKEEILDIKIIEAQINNLRFSNFQISYDNNLVLKFTLSDCLVDILLN